MITYLYAILFKLTSARRREKHKPSKYIEVSAYSDPVSNTIRFLEDNYMKRLSLDDIVAQTPLKKSYLSSLFKKETTVTIFECLMIIRIRKAVELLSYTNMSLQQNCIAPGYINTDMYKAVPKEIVAEHLKLVPLRRLGEPDEVAGAVSFLAIDDASFISSQCLVIRGGSM